MENSSCLREKGYQTGMSLLTYDMTGHLQKCTNLESYFNMHLDSPDPKFLTPLTCTEYIQATSFSFA